MAWKFSVLVVANVTATSDELLAALEERARRESVRFTLIVPATAGRGGRARAEERRDAALARMREAGLEVEGRLGDSDPVVAVHQAWDPREWDEVIVSTLPGQTSKWLEIGLPSRVERITGVPVAHVVAREERAPIEGSRPRQRERWGVLSPLRALGWGRAADPPESPGTR